jgi:hypothetical protein
VKLYKTVYINRSNVAGALQRPKGMTLNCHSPLPVENVVLSLSSGCRSTCQYPLFRSRVGETSGSNQRVLIVVNPRQWNSLSSWRHSFSCSPRRSECSRAFGREWRGDQGLSDSSTAARRWASSLLPPVLLGEALSGVGESIGPLPYLYGGTPCQSARRHYCP